MLSQVSCAVQVLVCKERRETGSEEAVSGQRKNKIILERQSETEEEEEQEEEKEEEEEATCTEN